MSERLQVALIDDDRLFGEAVSTGLRRESFDVTVFDDGFTALDALLSEAPSCRPDVIVLDWRMPSIDGPTVLQRLRDAGIDLPVVMLTSLSDQVYEESALSSGAVDFVDKERSIAILAKRLRLAAERAGGAREAGDEAAEAATVGHLHLDLSARRARWKGKEVDLTLNEFDMVALMARRPGRDVTYRELYDVVHGSGFQSGRGDDGYRGNVRGFIKRIRRKFTAADPGFDEVENYPGFGYRWRVPDET